MPPVSVMIGTPTINQVSTRELLSMRSGLRDYNDLQCFAWTTIQSTPRDIEPMDFLLWATPGISSFQFAPNGGGAYSGTGFIMAGMALSEASGASEWFDLRQEAIFNGSKLHPMPPAKRAWYANQTLFARKGACTQFGPRVIPQYANYATRTKAPDPNAHPNLATDFLDTLSRQSCLNGWVMGNVLSTAAGVAQFYVDLYARPNATASSTMLSADSISQMTKFQPLTQGAVPPKGTPYGLGQMLNVIPFSALGVQGDGRTATVVGHGGEDWGSGAPLAMWSVDLSMGFTLMVNNCCGPMGMNSALTWAQNEALALSCLCFILDVLYRYRGQAGLNCPGKPHAARVGWDSARLDLYNLSLAAGADTSLSSLLGLSRHSA